MTHQDELRVANNDEQHRTVLQLYERATSEYISVELWMGRLQLAVKILSEDEVRALYEEALISVGLHVDAGPAWAAWREWEGGLLGERQHRWCSHLPYSRLQTLCHLQLQAALKPWSVCELPGSESSLCQ